jgi:hypothetical protein
MPATASTLVKRGRAADKEIAQRNAQQSQRTCKHYLLYITREGCQVSSLARRVQRKYWMSIDWRGFCKEPLQARWASTYLSESYSYETSESACLPSHTDSCKSESVESGAKESQNGAYGTKARTERRSDNRTREPTRACNTCR